MRGNAKKPPIKRKLVYGWGVNDADYVVKPKSPTTGKGVVCPAYNRWVGMLERAFCPKCHVRQPTYVGTTICEEWRSFMAFRAWYLAQEAELGDLTDLAIDKDILTPGNKHYSPENCVFVPQSLNSLLNHYGARLGAYPKGVAFHKPSGRLQAQVCENGKGRYLGLFDTPEEASLAYRKAKMRLVLQEADKYKASRPDLAAGLTKHAYLIREG